MTFARCFDPRPRRFHFSERRSVRRRLIPRLEELEDRLTPSTLIPVMDHRDLVFDPGRDLLYITTSSGLVQRWDVANQQLLPAWTVGSSLDGADVTPDGKSLYAAEDTTGLFYQVDLNSGAVTGVPYNLVSRETGSWDIAIAANGKALISTHGSSTLPLRQLDTATNTYTTRSDDPGVGNGSAGMISQGSIIHRSADRSLFLISEANFSSGPLFLYNANTDQFSAAAEFSYINLNNTSPVVNRNGTLMALEVSGGASVFDSSFRSVQNLSNLTGGIVFDPNQDMLYGVDPIADQIDAYDTNTWTLKYTLPVGETIGTSSDFGTGVFAVSPGGQYLFLTTPSGVREYTLPEATGVASSLSVSGFPLFIKDGVTGTVTVTAKDPAGNVATSYLGTVQLSSTSAGSLPPEYTFKPSDNGSHTFDVTLTSTGTQSLTATDQINGLTSTESSIVVHDPGTNYIPIKNYRDLVFDPTRYLLYITTSDGLVQRYDPVTETLLAPFQVGNRLEGADITCDGGSLYVADDERGVAQGWIHHLDLVTGTITNAAYWLSANEGGSYDVAVGANAKALVTIEATSGLVPLFQLDTTTDTLTIRTDDPGSGGNGMVWPSTSIARSVNHTLFALAERGSGLGPVFTYSSLTDSFPSKTSLGAGIVRSAVSPNDSLIGESEGDDGGVFDANFNLVWGETDNQNDPDTYVEIYATYCFDPLREIVYVADVSSDTLYAVATNNWSLIFQTPIGEVLPNNIVDFSASMMAVSSDGSLLFLGTPSEIHIFGTLDTISVSGFPSPSTSGSAGNVTVTAQHADGSTDTGYRGTVHFTSSDPQANLPADYTFTAADNGRHTFSVTLNTLGTQSITVTELARNLTGTQSGIIVDPAGITVNGFPSPITVASAGNVTVRATNTDGSTDTGYRGTVHFTSSDSQASLPADYTFTAADNGRHSFSVTLNTIGTQSITATDIVSNTFGTQSGIIVNPLGLSVSGFPSPITAGAAGNAIVTALNSNGFTDTSYRGTVHFTSSDPQANLPADYTFTAADNGRHTFSVTLFTAGSQSITATDFVSDDSGTQSDIIVQPAAPDHLLFSVQPSNTIAGSLFNPAVEVGVFDKYANLETLDNNDQVETAFGNNPTGASLSGTTTLTVSGGIATFSDLTIETAGIGYTFTATLGALPIVSSSAFNILAAPPDHLAFAVQPSDTIAGSVMSPAVIVQELDRYGNLEIADNSTQVTLETAGELGTFDPGSTTRATVNGGVATFSNLILDSAGTFTLTEDATGGLTGADSNSFTIYPIAPDHLAFGVQPSDTTAGVAIRPAVQVEVLDKYGNLVSTDNTDQVTLSVDSGPNGFDGGSTMTVTASGGVATFGNLILDIAGSYTLGESATGGLTGPDSVSFTVSPAVADHLFFGVQPNDTLAGDPIAPPVKVNAYDRFGNPCTNDNTDPVTLSVAGGPGDFDVSSTTTVTVSGGIAVFNNLILDTAGAYSLAENATGGVTGLDSITFSVGPAAANNLRFSVQPTNTTAGVAIPPVKVQVVDRFGNLIQADNSTQVTLSVASGPGDFTPDSTTTATAVGGIATFRNLVLDTAGNYTLAENAMGGLTGSHSAGFAVNPATPDHIGFAVQPSDASAGFPINPAVDVAVLDIYGNVATQDNTDQVTLSVATGPGGFAGSSKTTLTVTGGVAHFNNLVLVTPGSYTLAESATGGLTGPDSNSFTVSPAVADHLIFSAQPSNTFAGSAISPAVQVEVFDKYGNLLTGDNHDQVTLTVAKGPDIFAAGSTTTVTANAGVATFNNLILDTAGTYTLAENLAGSGSVTGPNSNSFTVSGLGADHLGFSVPPAGARAGLPVTPAVTVGVYDKYNNLVSGDNSDQVTLTIASGPAGFDSGSTTTATVSGGVATFSNLLFDTVGTYVLGESGTGGLAGFNSNSFPVVPGLPDHLVFSVQPSNTMAGSAISPAVQIKLYDKFGNLATNDSNDQVTMTVASGPGGFDPSSTTTTKFFSGVALFTNLVLDTAGTYTLTANSGSVTGPASDTFTVSTLPKADHLVFSVQPTGTTAGAALIPAVQVKVVDKYGNLMSGDNTDVVKLTVASGPGGFDPASKTTATVSGGIATFALILDTAGTYTLGESTTGGLTGANSSSFTISAASGPPAHLAFGTQPTETFAGTPIIPAVQVKLLDPYGNVITADNSDQVSIYVASGPGDFDPAGTTTVTVSSGIATFSKLILDTAGTYTLGATGPGGASGPPSGSFTITPYYVADHLGFSAQPSDVAAGSAMQPAVQVDVFDQYGNVLTPDSSIQVTLSVASGPGVLDPASTTTVKISAGVATFSNLIFDTAGTYTLRETALGPITGPDSVGFTVRAASTVGRLGFLAQPGDTTAGAAISPALEVQLFDRYGNPLSGDSTDQVSMAIGLNPAHGTLSGTTTVTAQNGIATFAGLSIDKAATGYELTASSNGALKNSTLFSVNAGAATHLVVTGEPADITAGTGFTVIVSAEDDFGNIDTNFTGSVTISLANNPGDGTLGGTTTVNFFHGVATFNNLTLTVADTGYSFTFVTPGLPSITTTADVQVTPAAATQLAALPLTGGMPTAGSGFNVQVAAEDAFGNLNSAFTGQVSATLASNPSGGTLSGPATATAQAGVATFTGLSLSQGGPYGLSFTSGSLTPASSAFTELAFQHALPAVKEDSSNPAGIAVSTLLGSNYQDSDSSSKPGIALTTTIGNGTWQYSGNGKRWLNVPAVSATAALLLPASYQIRFVPALHWTGRAGVVFYAWDGSTGKAGGLASTTVNGGTSAFSLAPAQDNLTVTAINHAPMWLPGSAALTPVLPGGSNLSGDSVSSIFAGNFQDVESCTAVGVAVTGLSGTSKGSWQYSLDGGANWLSFGAPSLSAARLLSGDDLLRFVPNATAGLGVVTLQAHAWDQTSGKDGQTASLKGKGLTGGQTAFSLTPLTAGFAINDAPVLSAPDGPILPVAFEDGPPITFSVGTLLANESDPDPAARRGVALVAAEGPGSWQFSLNGMSWSSVGAVSETVERLLPVTAQLRFQPGLHQSGQATLIYRAWDQTEGAAGTLFTVNGSDGPFAFSSTEATATLSVSGVNHAPTWSGGGPQLPALLPGTSNPAGATIDSLFGGNFHDVDGDATHGIAVTGLTGTGSWQYQLDGGSGWQNVGSVSSGTALLLSGLDEIRFVPAAGFSGMASLQANAWDGTSGTDGGTANLFGFGATGGFTAFSATSLTAKLAVNTAPTLASATGPTLPGSGTVSVTTLLAGQGSGLKGVAIVGVSGSGTWQYTLDGKHWQGLGAVSETLARLLPSKAQLRYLPSTHQSGPVTLTYRAWDQTAGTAGSLFAVSGTGGASALSSTEATATLSITAVHRAPMWTGRGAALTPVLSHATNPAGDTIASVFGPYFNVDVRGATPGIAVTGLTGSSSGVWQYSLDGGTTWTAFGAVSPSAARLLSGSDRIRFVPNAGFAGMVSLTAYAWDGTSGSDGGLATLSGAGKTGGGTAFSTTALTATCLVNTAPVLLA
jgi:hypothetical protein